MVETKLTWLGPEVEKRIWDELEKRISKSITKLHSFTKMMVSKNQPTRRTGNRKRGLNPSRAGQYPKKVTGKFAKSLKKKMRHNAYFIEGKFFSDGLLGIWLQMGTRNMDPRPWMSKALKSMEAPIRRIIEKEIV